MAKRVMLQSLVSTGLACLCLAALLAGPVHAATPEATPAANAPSTPPAEAAVPSGLNGSAGINLAANPQSPIVPVTPPSLNDLPALPSPLLDHLDEPITQEKANPVLAQLPSLCAKALGAATCKDHRGFNLVAKRGRTFLFSAFYGADDTAFYCQVTDDRIVLSAKPWGEKRLAASYKSEPGSNCVEATVGLTLCDTQRTVRACSARAEADRP